MHSLCWISLPLVLVASGCPGPGTPRDGANTPAPSGTNASLANQASRILDHVLLSNGELGKDFVRARYGQPNPACWTMATAPSKARRRLSPFIRAGASRETRLCYFEYLRKGTHDDILVKILIFANADEARRALTHPYLLRKGQRLAAHGLAAPRRRNNLVYYVTASKTNLDKAREILTIVPAKLRRLGW